MLRVKLRLTFAFALVLFWVVVGGLLSAFIQIPSRKHLASAAQEKSTASAQPSSTEGVWVIVTGRGSTTDEATKDALRKAIGQVLGALVDSETIIKDDKVIADKILIYSKGFISYYQEIKQWKEDGLFNQKILAKVEKKELAGKLVKEGLTIKEFDGRKLFAKITNELREAKEGREVLQSMLKSFPSSVLKAELTEDPKPQKKSETEVTLAYDVVLSTDMKKYGDFLDRTLPILDMMAFKKGKFTISNTTGTRELIPGFYSQFLSKDDLPSAEALKRAPGIKQVEPRKGVDPWWSSDFDPTTQMVLLVNTSRTKLDFSTEWSWYHIHLTELVAKRVGVHITFLAGDDKEVEKQTVVVGPMVPGFEHSQVKFVRKKERSLAEGTQVLISPYFIVGPYITPKILFDKNLTLPLAKLAAIRSIRCNVFDVLVRAN